MKKNICSFLLALCLAAASTITAPTAQAAATFYTEEYSYPTGITLSFPEAVAYDIGSSRLAEIVDGKDGKPAVRFKRPGDLQLKVHFNKAGYGEFTRTFLIHITGQAVDETAVNRADFARQILTLVNAERAKTGAQPLTLSDELNQAADVRSWEIVKQFSHTRPDGRDCFTVLKNKKRGVGENIAAGMASPQKAMESWMNSPGHKANILKPEFKELGVGYTYINDSEFKHYWVQIFRA